MKRLANYHNSLIQLTIGILLLLLFSQTVHFANGQKVVSVEIRNNSGVNATFHFYDSCQIEQVVKIDHNHSKLFSFCPGAFSFYTQDPIANEKKYEGMCKFIKTNLHNDATNIVVVGQGTAFGGVQNLPCILSDRTAQ